MRHSVVLSSVAAVLIFEGAALADDKSDAQAKIDAAKTEVCEKGKKFLAGQADKGKCTAENDEAKKITCSAATSRQVNDLMTKCTTAKPADKPADPAAAAGTKCRALEVADNKTVIVEAEDKLVTKCTKLMIEALQKKWCTAENKGKKFDYMTDFDHMVGTGKLAKKVAGKKSSWTCRTVAK